MIRKVASLPGACVPKASLARGAPSSRVRSSRDVVKSHCALVSSDAPRVLAHDLMPGDDLAVNPASDRHAERL